jgi:hypothetical protein
MKIIVNYFQQAKKTFTNTVIKDPELNAMAHKYIEAQTQFATMLLDNTENMMKYNFDKMSKGAKNEQ